MKYEMLLMTGNNWEGMKSRTFFLHLGVVQEKSAYCQESPNNACCRYSCSEGRISCQSDCCHLVGSMSGFTFLS